MVARGGVEPPTPAFSVLVQPEPTTITGLRGTAKYLQIRASLTNRGLRSRAERSISGSSLCFFFNVLLAQNTAWTKPPPVFPHRDSLLSPPLAK